MITPRKPPDKSPEEDPTGVRALLSSMPEPEPMPIYLVERISASLAAEQARRSRPDEGVTPLRTSGPQRGRHYGKRLGTVLAGAAAVAAIALIGSNLLSNSLNSSSGTTASGGAAFSTVEPLASGPEAARDLETTGSDAALATKAARLEMAFSGTDYTSADLSTQARRLLTRPQALHPFSSGRDAAPAGPPPASPTAGVATGLVNGAGALRTEVGMSACLKSIGVSLGAGDSAIADFSTYDGTPAVVVVTTHEATHVAYVVRLDCSASNAALITAMPLP